MDNEEKKLFNTLAWLAFSIITFTCGWFTSEHVLLTQNQHLFKKVINLDEVQQAKFMFGVDGIIEEIKRREK